MTEEKDITQSHKMHFLVMALNFLFVKSFSSSLSALDSAHKEMRESFLSDLKADFTKEERKILETEVLLLQLLIVSQLAIIHGFTPKIKDPPLQQEYMQRLAPMVKNFSHANNFLKEVLEIIKIASPSLVNPDPWGGE